MRIYLPEKLNLTEHLKNFPPPPIPKFSEAKLALILGQIIVVKSNNRNIVDDTGAVPLHSGTLQKICREYRHYLDYAWDTKITIENHQFIRGEFCRHYKFNPIYESLPKVYEPVKFHIPKNVSQSSNNIVLPKNLKFLAEPFNAGGLKIHYDEVKDLYMRQHKYYLKHPDKVPTKRMKDSDERKKKNPYDIIESAIYILDRVKAKDYFMKIDDTSGRCHTPITNMPSLMRNYLHYDGQELVGVDISCCQPYELNGLFRPQFYGGNEKLNKKFLDPKITNESIFTGIDEEFNVYTMTSSIDCKLFSNTTSINTIFNLVNQCQTSARQEIERFMEKTTTGAYYQEFQEHLITECGDRYKNMGEVKVEGLRVMYTSNHFIDPPKEVFKKYYPTIYDITCFYKTGDKTLLPILLQTIESFIILKRVARRLHKENPKLVFFTVHDSIITTVGNEHYVAEVMKQEFARCIGPEPHIKFEYYRPDSEKLKRLPYYK